MNQVVFIAIGGALGSVTRYGISKYVNQLFGSVFPWGTMAVNFLGLFIVGFVFEFFERTILPSELRAFVTVGFLGGLTTFSTYGLESLNLFRNGTYGLGLLNIILSNIAGIGLVMTGIVVARLILRG